MDLIGSFSLQACERAFSVSSSATYIPLNIRRHVFPLESYIRKHTAQVFWTTFGVTTHVCCFSLNQIQRDSCWWKDTKNVIILCNKTARLCLGHAAAFTNSIYVIPFYSSYAMHKDNHNDTDMVFKTCPVLLNLKTIIIATAILCCWSLELSQTGRFVPFSRAVHE